MSAVAGRVLRSHKTLTPHRSCAKLALESGSAALAAHVPGAGTLEANAREYVPAANEAWVARFPGLFRIRDGTMATSEIAGPGLGAVAPVRVV